MEISRPMCRHVSVYFAMFSQAECIYQGIADHLPMSFFVFIYMGVTISVCLYIQVQIDLDAKCQNNAKSYIRPMQWQVTALLLLAIPLLIGTRLVFSRVIKGRNAIIE